MRVITGWHVMAMFLLGFGTIIAVNVTLAVNAVRTFPGLEVKNSYVASQEFDVRKDAQEALGWTVRAEAASGQLRLSFTDKAGNPVEVSELKAVLGRATHVKEDVEPALTFDGTAYVAPADLDKGNWNIRLVARDSDGAEFSQRVPLYVKG